MTRKYQRKGGRRNTKKSKKHSKRNFKKNMQRNKIKRGGVWDKERSLYFKGVTYNFERAESDTNQFYKYYLLKNAIGKYENIFVNSSELFPGEDVDYSLFVIDMQRDFIDQHFKEGRCPTPSGDTIGNFAVTDGVKLIKSIPDLINKEKFKNIIFSRDTHDREHCSFTVYPQHCEINHMGGAFPETWKTNGFLTKMQTYANNKDSDITVKVIFKGMHPRVDSYGALPYDTSYYEDRFSEFYKEVKPKKITVNGKKPDIEVYPCCQTGNLNEKILLDPKYSDVSTSMCSSVTGGYELKVRNYQFNDKPFPTQSGTGCSPNETCTYESLKNTFKTIPFSLSDLKINPERKHIIFITGLAGDFCCKDTAINLMAQIRNAGLSDKVKVVVLFDYVRYAFLPLIVENPKYRNMKDDKLTLTINGKFFEKNEKPIDYYLFKLDESNNKILLNPNEPDSPDNPNEFNKLMNKNIKEEMGVNDLLQYFHFITPQQSILDDYAQYGVNVMFGEPF